MKSSYTKKITAVSAVALLGVAALSTANVANAVTESGTADVSIVTALSATAGDNLDFGSIAAPETGDGPETMIVETDGTEGASSGDQLGTVDNGTFTIAGQASTSVDVTVAPVSCTSGDITFDSVSVEDAAGAGPGSDATDTFTLDGGGAGTANIGGQITVAENAASGASTCTFNFTVDYS